MSARIADKYGINAQKGEVTTLDIQGFQAARLGAIRLRTDEHSAFTVQAYRQAGAFFFNALITLPDFHSTRRTSEQFVAATLPKVREFADAGVGAFEVGIHPNTALGGYGLNWNSPAEFANWYRDVVFRFRQALPGRGLRFGFPALMPGEPRGDGDPVAGNRPRMPVRDSDFLFVTRDLVNQLDFLAVATYWNTTERLRDINGGLRFVREYHERFPGQTIVIAEFSNNRGDKAFTAPADNIWRIVGDEYAEFYTLCANYDWVEVAYCQLLRDATRPHESWFSPDNQPRRIFEGVQARPRLPESDEVSFFWPTQYKRVTQPYGIRQLDYAGFSGGSLRGGHEGIDLAAPYGSELYACMGGTVVHSGGTSGPYSGYGAYGRVVVIESDVPNVGRFTLTYAHMLRQSVSTGQVVRAGQLIGYADTTGNAQGAHLHLSVRIAGVRLPTTLDYLNPGLYLGLQGVPTPISAPRGAPRMQYARTYVLLPPNLGLDWVEALLRATWDKNRFTIGGSADDAGVGDLNQRRVIAINPAGWSGDLRGWLNANYPGVDYTQLDAANPANLEAQLRTLNLPGVPVAAERAGRGAPRTQYKRVYILLPPRRGTDWAIAAARATWNKYRATIGGSADDAGVGDLDARRVIAVNPTEWGGGDLGQWYAGNYPGVQYSPIVAISPLHLEQQLAALQL